MNTRLVTGVAGFIGSNLLQERLKFDQVVVGLDIFSTGKQRNLGEVQVLVGADRWLVPLYRGGLRPCLSLN